MNKIFGLILQALFDSKDLLLRLDEKHQGTRRKLLLA